MVHLCSGVPVFSLVVLALLSSWFHSSSSVQLGAPVFSLDTGVPRITVSVRCLAGAGLRVQAAPQHKGLLLPGERIGSLPLPFIFLYLCSDSQLPTSYLNTRHWRCSFVEIQMYLPASQADSVDVQAGLVPIQLDLGLAEKGVPHSSAILTPSRQIGF